MEEGYRILYAGGSGEIVEKKSRFIASTAPASSEEEALQFIESIKKQHWSARHNCYAYVIGERQQLQRCSDDGEPAQTAGKPMLEVLLAEGVHNIVLVVTRYFGGVLLGTGGLVRAYTKAAAEGLKNSQIVTRLPGQLWTLRTDYSGIGKLQYLFGQQSIAILSSEYAEDVTVTAAVPESSAGALKKALTEATNGRIKYEDIQRCEFADIDGAVHIF